MGRDVLSSKGLENNRNMRLAARKSIAATLSFSRTATGTNAPKKI